MVPVGWIESAAPSEPETFCLEADDGPDGRVGDAGGLITHSQVNRQSGALQVEAFRGSGLIRIELRDNGSLSVT